MSISADENKATGEMAFAMAELDTRCIGPNGTVLRVDAEDAPILRASFISRLSEAAMKILDQEATK